MTQITVAGTAVPFVASPNHAARPRGMTPELLVLHSTECGFGVAQRWLCARESEVSAHFLVARDGRIVQLVPLERAAWHAGVSRWRERERVNGFSIGIEMERLDGVQDWPARQLAAVAALCHTLITSYRLPVDHIVSHAEIARPLGRKVDPVGFPWARLRELVGQG